MAVLPILKFPDARLKKKSIEVEHVDDSIRQLLKDMWETMLANAGAGLAAPQVNVHKRVVVMDISERENQTPQPLFLINPVLTVTDPECDGLEEGCLSVGEGEDLPRAFVKRPKGIHMTYLNEKGVAQAMDLTFPLSIVVQHEVDHLDGVLFIDRLAPFKKQKMIRSLLKK